ncbi:MAG: hypothetical protein H6558_21720 [Lewinellaceae bacterium]|nr:hypothetical protein [Lewinellaceae bacterium]
MPELSKHELDKLFRKGAEGYNIRYNPAAWEQMKGMLDRRRRRRIVFWWISGIAAFLLLASLACCFFFQGSSLLKNKSSRQPARAEVAHGPENEAAAGEKRRKSETFSPQKPRPEEPGPGEGAREQKANRVAKTGRAANTSPSPGGSPGSKPDERTSGVVAGPTAAHIPTKPPEDAGNAEETLPASHTQAAISSCSQKSSPEGQLRAWREPLAFLPKLPLSPFRQESGTGKAEAKSVVARNKEQPEQRPGRSSHLFVGSAFSAGFNSIGWGDFSGGSWKAGFFAEYQYQGRLSLGLGASLLRMNYVAGKGEYMPPYGFWTRRIAPESTRGLCNMLEIPVLLKYYPGGYSGKGFFVSAGASSYVFLMEEYWYEYAAEDPDLIRWWQTGKDQAHWFAFGQLAAGYQASLSKRWALQVEPYLQIPFSGVGHGQVEIYSLGINARLLWKAW